VESFEAIAENLVNQESFISLKVIGDDAADMSQELIQLRQLI